MWPVIISHIIHKLFISKCQNLLENIIYDSEKPSIAASNMITSKKVDK